MAGQDRVLGEQLDIKDVASDIAADPIAIDSIAVGVEAAGSPPTLDASYLRRDGTTTMDGTLTLSGANNIVVGGTVDTRDVAADGATLDSHIFLGSPPIHFTEVMIDHVNILNIGTNTHTQIDAHVANAALHFTEANIDHTAIQNIGSNSHASIDAHVGNSTLHFAESAIDHVNILNIGTNTHAQIDTHITTAAAHVADATIHFTEASIVHQNILGVGINTHPTIDVHIADTALHFSTLDGLSDVSVAAPAIGQVLTYSNSPMGWFAETPLPQSDLGEFTLAGLPAAAANANSYALATDASGGRTIVRSDGTNWKIVVVEGATVS